MALPLRNAADAEKLLRSVSSPKSTGYGAYLSSAQFNAKYAPTKAAVTRVTGFLKGAGMTVKGVGAGNRVGHHRRHQQGVRHDDPDVQRQGSASQRAVVRAQRPASIRGDVLAVTGLTQSFAHPNVVTPDTGKVNPSAAPVTTSACSSYWDQYEQTMRHGPLLRCLRLRPRH